VALIIKKKKYLILHLIVGLGDGGAEATLYKLIYNDHLNAHVVVSLTNLGKYGAYFNKIKVPVHTLRFNKFRTNLIGFIKLLRLIKEYKPDILQSWMYHSDFITCFVKLFYPKIKIIWNIRNTLFNIKDSYLRYFVSKFCSIFSQIVPEKIVSCSFIAMKQHVSFGYTKKKFKIIFNGVDTNIFNSNVSKLSSKYLKLKKKFVSKKKINLGMVARYDKQKGYSILLESLSLLKKNNFEFNCFLVGRNVDYKNYELNYLVKKYNLFSNVILLGQQNNLKYFYNFIDLSILSSTSGEGFPNVLIESMACETPCVATDVGETKFIIKETGWITKPSNAVHLYNSLKKAILEFNSPSWTHRKSMCKKIVKEKYNINLMKQNFSSLWISLLEKKNKYDH
jgi:glycosyltransferase involved in cell wall biosynthesis